MHQSFLPTFVLPFLLLQLSHAGEIGYTDLPACAQDCGIEFAMQVNCYLPTDALCWCSSLQLRTDAYQCTIPACANESAQTQKIVEDWFNMVCEIPSDDSKLGSGFGTTALSDPTPTLGVTGSSTSATGTKPPSAKNTGDVKATDHQGSNSTSDGASIETSTSDSGGIGVGAIGGIVGAVVGVLAIGVGVWLWRRSHREPKPTGDVLPEPSQWAGTRYEIGGGEISTPPQKFMPEVYEADSGKRDAAPSELPAYRS